MSEVNNRDPSVCRNERKSFVRCWSIRWTRTVIVQAGEAGQQWRTCIYRAVTSPEKHRTKGNRISRSICWWRITFVFSWSVADTYLQVLFWRTRTAPLATDLADPFVCGADYNCIRRRSFMVSGGHASAVTLMEDCAPTETETGDPSSHGQWRTCICSYSVGGLRTNCDRNSLSFCF